jgi:hypothetical protein
MEVFHKHKLAKGNSAFSFLKMDFVAEEISGR